jgi:hypothetical protein
MSRKNPTIYDRIDNLDGAKTVQDLAARIKPILEELAYMAQVGDGAAFQAHEQWHDDYTDLLYQGTEKEYKKTQHKNVPTDSVSGPVPKISASGPAPKASAPVTRRRDPPEFVDDPYAMVHSLAQPRQQKPPTRPSPDAISPSLRSILDGSHPTLREHT